MCMTVSLSAYEFLQAGTSARVILVGQADADEPSDVDGGSRVSGKKKRNKRDVQPASAPARKRARGSKAVAHEDDDVGGETSTSGGAGVLSTIPGVKQEDDDDQQVEAQVAIAKLKFAEFCDGLLRRWEGNAGMGPSPTVSTLATSSTTGSLDAGQKAVEAFAELHFMTKAQLAKYGLLSGCSFLRNLLLSVSFSRLITVNILEAVGSGDKQARRLIPRTLQLMVDYPSIRPDFTLAASMVPSWMYLPWISQLMAMLSTDGAEVVVKVLVRVRAANMHVSCGELYRIGAVVNSTDCN